MKTVKYILFMCFITLNSVTYSQVKKIQQKNNFYQIVAQKRIEFDKKFKTLKSKSSKTKKSIEKEYKKYLRWQWFWESRVDENGGFGTYSKEIFNSKNLANLKTKNNNLFSRNGNTSWQIIGPEAFPTGYNYGGQFNGIGRIDAIVVDPNNQNHVIIGARNGGIWETYNINATNVSWSCLTNNIPLGTVNDLKIVGNTLFAASSNISAAFVQGNSLYGLGVIKKDLNSTEWIMSNEKFECKKIAVSSVNPNVMYAVGYKGVYKSINAGDSWKKLTNPIPNLEESLLRLTNIEINPNNDNIVIITGRTANYDSTFTDATNILAFKTINGGKTWTNLTNSIESLINNTLLSANANDLQVDFQNSNGYEITTFLSTNALYLGLKTPNSKVYFITLTGNWDNMQLFNTGGSTGMSFGYSADNASHIFHVVNNNKIILGARYLYAVNKSAGTSSIIVNGGGVHQDIRSINYNSQTGRLLVGTDGGVNMSFDNSNDLNFNTFSSKSGNLNLFLTFNMSYININGTRTIRIGNQDTGWYRSDNTGLGWNGWERFANNLAEGMVYSDHSNADIVYINRQRYIYKTINGASSSSTFGYKGIKVGEYSIKNLTINPVNSNQLIFDNIKPGENYYPLHISNNQLNTFYNISNGVDKLIYGRNSAVTISKNNPAVFYVARRQLDFKVNGISNSIYKSVNLNTNNPSAITYTEITNNLAAADADILNKAFITDIEIDDANENNLWISFGNLQNGKKIYHSTNGGASWVNISGNLPNIPANDIEYDAVNQTLFLATDYGVYSYSTTSGLWARFGNGLPVAIVTTIKIDNTANEIIASTHGRSVWTASLGACSDYVINGNVTWNTDHTICGDLIINSGSLTLNNAKIKADNIIIKSNTNLTVNNGELMSNYYASSNNDTFNTNLIVNSNANFYLKDTKLYNFEVEVNANANLYINSSSLFLKGGGFGGGGIGGSTILYHSKIKVLNNAYYYHNNNALVNLSDIYSSINLFENYHLSSISIFAKKIDEINFTGLGNLNVFNTNSLYLQNETLSTNNYNFDSDDNIKTGFNVTNTTNGNFNVINAKVILKAGVSIVMDPGTLIDTSSFVAYIDNYDISTFNKQNNKTTVKENKTNKHNMGGDLINSLLVYPNPVSKFLNIKMLNDVYLDTEILIFDTNGKQMFKSVLNNDLKVINLENYPTGLYIINFKKNDKVVLKKIIKI